MTTGFYLNGDKVIRRFQIVPELLFLKLEDNFMSSLADDIGSFHFVVKVEHELAQVIVSVAISITTINYDAEQTRRKN